MRAGPGCERLLAGHLGIVNCVHGTKKLDAHWEFKRVNPPFIRIHQVRRTRHYNDFPPNWRGDKNQQLSAVAATHLLAHRQGAKDVSYPPAAANDHRSLSISHALEHQPQRERYPSASAQLKTDKPTPPPP